MWDMFLGFHLDRDRLANLASVQMTKGEAEANPAALRPAEPSP